MHVLLLWALHVTSSLPEACLMSLVCVTFKKLNNFYILLLLHPQEYWCHIRGIIKWNKLWKLLLQCLPCSKCSIKARVVAVCILRFTIWVNFSRMSMFSRPLSLFLLSQLYFFFPLCIWNLIIMTPYTSQNCTQMILEFYNDNPTRIPILPEKIKDSKIKYLRKTDHGV